MPGEQEELTLRRNRMRSAPEIKSLATQDLYDKLANQISRLEERLDIVNSLVPEWMDKNIPLTNPKAMLQLGARLEKSESEIAKLTASLFDIASNVDFTDTSEPEGPWGQKLIVGYVMVSQKGRAKRLKAKESHSRTCDWETADAGNADSTLSIKESKIKGAKPVKEKASSKLMKDDIPYSELEINNDEGVAPKHVGVDPALEPISKPLLLQKTRELKEEIMKDFDERAKKLAKSVREIEKELNIIVKSMFDLQPLEDTIEDIEQLSKNTFARQNQLNVQTLELGVYQDELFDMQQGTEDAIAKMQETLANRKSDVDSINQLHQDMTYLYLDCQVLYRAQKDIAVQQKDYCKELKVLLQLVFALNKTKCSRLEFWEALESKAGLFDLNTFMSSVHFAANYGDLQRILATKVDKFQAREYTWQRQIDEIYIKFHDTVGIDQLEVVNADARNKTNQLKKTIDFYISIVDPYKRQGEPEQTRTRNEEKCLSCFTCDFKPFIKLSPEEEPDKNTVCYPSAPAPKDKRCAKNKQPCQKHAKKEDITAAMTVSALETKPPVPKETQAIDTSNKKLVDIPCKPCNKMKYENKPRDAPTQWNLK